MKIGRNRSLMGSATRIYIICALTIKDTDILVVGINRSTAKLWPL